MYLSVLIEQAGGAVPPVSILLMSLNEPVSDIGNCRISRYACSLDVVLPVITGAR